MTKPTQEEPVQNPDTAAGDTRRGPDGDSGDQDIDTAGTEADPDPMTSTGPSARKGGAPRAPDARMADAPGNENPPIGSHNPGSLHRREDDEEVRLNTPEFHNQPGYTRR